MVRWRYRSEGDQILPDEEMRVLMTDCSKSDGVL